jgi:hypothetical protein
MLFVKPGRSIPKPQPVQLFGEPIHSVDTTRYLGVTLTAHLVASCRSGEKESGTETGSVGLRLLRLVVRRSLPYQKTAGALIQTSSHCYKCNLVHSNKQVREDLGVLCFTDHFRSLRDWTRS